MKGLYWKQIKIYQKKKIIELCNNLQNEFNNYYNTDDYSFSPERITEGGIVFNNFNNNINTYKSMRIYFVEKSNTCSRKKSCMDGLIIILLMNG